MTEIKQAIILAGGMGTRLRPLTYSVPKPMAPVNGVPFLNHLLRLLKKNGISQVVLLLGYLAEKVVDHYGDGSRFGMDIRHSIGDVSLETGSRIRNAEPLLHEDFLLMYCDNYWPLNLKNLQRFHEKQGTLATVTVYANRDGTTKNNTLVDEQGTVVKYDKSRRDPNLNGVEIGFFLLNRKALQFLPREGNISFEKTVFPPLIERRQLSGFRSEHRYYSIGTPERLALTETFLQPRKILFLDRDGVINRKAPRAEYIRNWGEFEFLPGVIDALKLFAEHGYSMHLITNQAGIARGVMTEDDLRSIHDNLLRELGKHNVRMEGIQYCPHGWDEGCACRKPKPGMFFQAAREHHLDLTRAMFIGDDERDAQAGEAAGVETLLVTPGRGLLEIAESIIQNHTENREADETHPKPVREEES